MLFSTKCCQIVDIATLWHWKEMLFSAIHNWQHLLSSFHQQTNTYILLLSVEQAEELLYWKEIGPRANTHQYALGSDKSFFFTPTAF